MDPKSWGQVKELFELALQRGASQRAAFLDQACGGDSPLRREVESLIASHERAPGFIEGSAPEAVAKVLEVDRSASVIGRRLGSYQIVRELGRGGMGAVYLAARADDEYRKQVAIKLIKRGMDSDAMLRRFRNERQILANLDHPDIAKLLDGGTTEDGLAYFVMEYVDGLPINAYCDTRKLAIIERLKLFCTACSAVHYAHQHNIVHRDLKPSNILITPEGIPKLLDFGIAKLLDAESPDQTVEPTSGLRPMTPQYASPEQVRGEAVTPAGDVYSLGVMLYELLSGQRPYQIQSNTPHEAARLICEREPEKPSAVVASRPSPSIRLGTGPSAELGTGVAQRSRGRVEDSSRTKGKTPVTTAPASQSETRDRQPEKLRRQLKGDLDNIALMALRKEPGRRYASVEQLCQDIQRHLEGLPVIARPNTLAYRGAKFIKRNKAVLLSSAVTALMLLALTGVGRFFQTKGQAIQSLAVLPLENLSGDKEQDYFADGMTEALINDLAQISALRVISRTSVMQVKGAHKPLPEVARQLNVDAVVTGSVLRSGDNVRITAELIHGATDRHLWAKAYERDARDILALHSEVVSAIAREIRIKLTSQEQVRLAKSRSVDREAYEAYLKGRFFWNKRTPDGLKRAAEFFQQAIEKDPTYALAYTGLADCYTLLPAMLIGGLPPREALPKANAAAMKALEIDETLAEAHSSMGNVKFFNWDWVGAEREEKRGIELNPNLSTVHHFYATKLAALGRLDEAIEEEKRAQRLDPLSLIINSWVGLIFHYARQYDRAIEQCRKTLEIDPSFFQARSCLVLAYQQKGMYEEALAEAEKAVTLSGNNPPVVARLGHAYALAGKRGDAMRILDELQDLSKRRYVSPYWMALIHVGLGEKDQASAWLERAYEEHASEMVFLKVQPELDSLRSDPRFDDLLRRLRFPP